MDLMEKASNINRHPWELSRALCLLNIFKKYSFCNAVDIGAGDCFFASKLQTLVSGKVYAIDTGYNEKPAIINGIHCFNDISKIPNLNSDDCIIMMDVLEHIQDDAFFYKNIIEKISEGTLMLITVPAFQCLFSEHDIFLKHYRRYNKKQLLALINSQNIRIEKIHYFYSSLFFARALVSLLQKIKRPSKQSGIGAWNFSEKHIITRLIYTILNIDFHVCAFFAKFHVYLPGLSLMAICRKVSLAIIDNNSQTLLK